jgi:hypothetical protein
VQAVTHGLGYGLGERLDAAFIRGALSGEDARALLHDPLADPRSTYFAWSSRFRAAGSPRRRSARA